jgi:hypothetical protein
MDTARHYFSKLQENEAQHLVQCVFVMQQVLTRFWFAVQAGGKVVLSVSSA